MKGFWCTRHLEMVGILWWAGSGRVGAVPWLARAPLEKCIAPVPPDRGPAPNLSQCRSAQHRLLPGLHISYSLLIMAWRGSPHGGPTPAAGQRHRPAAIFAEAWNGERCYPGACADRGVATRGPKPVLGSGQRGRLLQ